MTTRTNRTAAAFLSKRLAGSKLSVNERAFGLYPRSNRRVPHISLVFREMWDTEGLSLKPLAGPIHLFRESTGLPALTYRLYT
jgi:hypothetical protein